MNRRWRRIVAIVATLLAALIAVAVTEYHTWQHWLAFATGSFNVSGVAHNYNFFSGSGSDISELGIFSALAVILYHACRRGNCHMHGCWRIGGYPVGDFKVCRKHHAESTGVKHVDIERLKLAHHLHMRSKLINAGFSAGDDNGTPPSPTA
jgi:hypothetical protein